MSKAKPAVPVTKEKLSNQQVQYVREQIQATERTLLTQVLKKYGQPQSDYSPEQIFELIKTKKATLKPEFKQEKRLDQYGNLYLPNSTVFSMFNIPVYKPTGAELKSKTLQEEIKAKSASMMDKIMFSSSPEVLKMLEDFRNLKI